MVDAVEHGRHEGSEMIASMDVTPEEARRLLDAVRELSERSRAAKAEADRLVSKAAEARGAAIRVALEAGIPRDQIAQAAEVHRNLLYRLAKHAGESSGAD